MFSEKITGFYFKVYFSGFIPSSHPWGKNGHIQKQLLDTVLHVSKLASVRVAEGGTQEAKVVRDNKYVRSSGYQMG